MKNIKWLILFKSICLAIAGFSGVILILGGIIWVLGNYPWIVFWIIISLAITFITLVIYTYLTE